MASSLHRHTQSLPSLHFTLAVLAISLLLPEVVMPQGVVDPLPEDIKPRTCEALTAVTMCVEVYDNASFPNVRGHSTQMEANNELNQFLPLVQGNCSNAIVHFLCSIYAPLCQVESPEIITLPCRELCEYVLNGCEEPLQKFGLSWPPHLNCDNFPTNASSRTDFCPNVLEAVKIPSNINVNPVTTVAATTTTSTPSSVSGCPLSLTVTSILKNQSYSFGGISNCGVNCSGLYFSARERNLIAPIFILLFAIICVFFSLFTVATFLIDRRRFHYPERPIIFISFCYLVVSIVYIVGSISKLASQQNQAFSCSNEIAVVNRSYSSSFVFQRLPNSESTYKTASCVILFVVLYFFQMASYVWWVILTLTWFLAAALKWGEEAVEKMWLLYHVLAWGIPTIQVILVLALQLVDGDQISGLCYTGNSNNIGLGLFVFFPHLVYLLVGVIFVVIAFVALVKIKKEVARDEAKAKRIGRLVLRVGLYSVLYVSPNVIFLLLLIYELTQRSGWETSYIDDCTTDQTAACKGSNKPSLVAFLLKYMMMFLVGIFSTTWILSLKTFNAWHKLCCSCCTTGREGELTDTYSTKMSSPHIYDTPKAHYQPPVMFNPSQNSAHYVMASEKRDLSAHLSQPHTSV